MNECLGVIFKYSITDFIKTTLLIYADLFWYLWCWLICYIKWYGWYVNIWELNTLYIYHTGFSYTIWIFQVFHISVTFVMISSHSWHLSIHSCDSHLAKAALAKDLKECEVWDAQQRGLLPTLLALPPFRGHPHLTCTSGLSVQKKKKNHHLNPRRHIKAKITFELFWKKISLCTTELRLEIPSACRPISASLLASSTLLTPQLGATLPLQRMWTFILQTEGRNHTDEKTFYDIWDFLVWRANVDAWLTFTVQPLLD